MLCWKDSSKDVWLVGLIIFIVLFWSLCLSRNPIYNSWMPNRLTAKQFMVSLGFLTDITYQSPVEYFEHATSRQKLNYTTARGEHWCFPLEAKKCKKNALTKNDVYYLFSCRELLDKSKVLCWCRTFPLLLAQMGYGLLCGLWVWRRRPNRRPCCPLMSNPSTSSWTARPDGSCRWDHRLVAQHLPWDVVRPSSGQ